MLHIKKITVLILARITVISALLAVLLVRTPVFADPTNVEITCKDGQTVTATRSGSTFTDQDYQNACSSHGGYEAPSGGTGGGGGGGSPVDGVEQINPLGGTKASPPDANDLLTAKNTHTCGNGEDNVVTVAFDFGCIGSSYGKPLNPIIDIAFAIFRFLSAGVGLVVIGSIIVAGIQYSTSRGDPGATEASIKRITNSVIALLIYIFMFAIANFLVPGGMFIR